MKDFIIEGIEPKESLPNARIIKDGKSYTLHSIQPFKEAERIASKFNPSMKWVLIAGFGLGYIPEYLLINTEYQIIIFEHTDEIIEFAKKSDRVKKIINNKRVFLITNDSGEIIQFLDNNNIKELNFYIHRPYYALFHDIYSNLEGILIAYLSKKQINKATLKRFQKVWLKNIIKNSLFYFSIPGIKNIRHNFQNIPAVIVGAGPSLSKNINILKEAQDYLIIISTDTALSILYNNGIKADFVVSVDPQDKNTLYLLYSEYKEATLILDSAASFISLLKYNPAKTLFFDSIFPLYEELMPFWKEKGTLLCGGSVSTTAFDFARFLNCSPIIFIGQDLAYSQKHTHSEGSILEEFLYYRINRFETYEAYNAKSLIFSDKIEVKGLDGNKVISDRKFVNFVDWFKKEINFTQTEVINATEGGAYIEGASHQTLKKTVENFYNGGKINKSFSIEHDSENPYNFIIYLQEIINGMEHLISYGKMAFQASLRALSSFQHNNINQYELKIMTSFDRELFKLIKGKNSIAHFIELTMQESIKNTGW